MMVKAKGPVWHQKQKKRGMVPKGLTGIDKEATWGFSRADGWVYGHGVFCITTHEIPMIGILQWMPNSGHEGKYLLTEAGHYSHELDRICMDSKADDLDIFYTLREHFGIKLLTYPRKKGKHPSAERRKMLRSILAPISKRIYKERSYTVEPMQGVAKDIFELERCWMRGNESNRWTFAAMGIAMQMAQWDAYKEGRSTWAVKSDILGV